MADLLIKGMEMPRTCWDCVCVNGEFGYCQVNGQSICGFDSKSSWCPLVEVPTHGRLIDADELLKRKGDCYDHEGHLLYAVGTGNIMLAPTVIEASEVDNES